MPTQRRSYSRSERVEVLLQRELALLLQQHYQDPRFQLLTVSGVKISADLRHAKAYVTCLQTEETPKTIETYLNAHVHSIRLALAKVVSLRYLPELRFIYDDSVAYGNRLAALINAAN